jgi:hypothetical protein
MLPVEARMPSTVPECVRAILFGILRTNSGTARRSLRSSAARSYMAVLQAVAVQADRRAWPSPP